jgi:hypothetical protein
MNRMLRLAPILAVAGVALAAGCSNDKGSLQGVAPDFFLVDVNPNSATHDSTISPRAYLDKVSAWYFGHST